MRSSTDDPSEASVTELIHAFEHGHVVMSTGPYLMVEAASDAEGTPAIPGDDLTADNGQFTLRVVVRCPNWLEVNRVQVFLNGRPSPEHNYTVRSHGDWFASGPNVFDREIEFTIEEDTHVVVACGGEGRQLGALYGEKFGAAMPVAVSNPVYVDIDGDSNGDGMAFEPNGDDLGLPLPKPAVWKPSHGHDHPESPSLKRFRKGSGRWMWQSTVIAKSACIADARISCCGLRRHGGERDPIATPGKSRAWPTAATTGTLHSDSTPGNAAARLGSPTPH